MTRDHDRTSVADMANPSLSVISIVVADMPAALAFYRACGLVIDGQDDQSHASAEPVNGFTVMFDTQHEVGSYDPTWTPPTGGHRMSLAFDCGTPADVDALHTRLIGAGNTSHLPPFDAFWGQRYAVVLDPDGNHVDLFATLR